MTTTAHLFLLFVFRAGLQPTYLGTVPLVDKLRLAVLLLPLSLLNPIPSPIRPTHQEEDQHEEQEEEEEGGKVQRRRARTTSEIVPCHHARL